MNLARLTRMREGIAKGLLTALMNAPQRDVLRARGRRLLIVAAWGAVVTMMLYALITRSVVTVAPALLGTLANIVPTYMLLRGRNDVTARLTTAAMVALYPAMGFHLAIGGASHVDGGVWLLGGIVALVMLDDWRALALGAVQIAAEFAMLAIIAPDGTETVRATVHGVVGLVGCLILTHVLHSQEMLMLGSEAERAASDAAAREAQAQREIAVSALDAAARAEKRATDEREARAESERDHARMRQAKLNELADEFEGSIAEVVATVEASAQRMMRSALDLNRLAADAGREADEVAVGANQASTAAREVAGAVAGLTRAIAEISANVATQTGLSSIAHTNTDAGNAVVRALSERTTDIDGITSSIRDIASRTALLALNAAIEAARAGEAGNAFAIVASEVKNLAGQATLETKRISGLVEAIQGGVIATAAKLEDAATAVSEVASAASTIETAVAAQRQSASRIEQSAGEAARNADLIEAKIVRVAGVARETSALSDQVRAAAGGLSDSTRTLVAAADAFVDHLRRDALAGVKSPRERGAAAV